MFFFDSGGSLLTMIAAVEVATPFVVYSLAHE
jgi:hypothetical protein